MAETLAFLPSPRGELGMYSRGPTKVVDANEQAYSNTAKASHGARAIRNLAMFAKWANYTAVTIKLQRSYDSTDGTDGTWTDIPSGSITTSGTDVVVKPVAPWIRVNLTATLSASADTLEVWLFAEYGPPIA